MFTLVMAASAVRGAHNCYLAYWQMFAYGVCALSPAMLLKAFVLFASAAAEKSEKSHGGIPCE